MKIRLLPSVLLLAAVAVSSCSDDELQKNQPVPTGNEIKFGAVLEQDVMSRTHYGDEANDPNAVKWPIYWNYPDNLDEIFIYSPQGATGRNQATYTVHPTDATQSVASDIIRNGAFGVQTGTDTQQPYDFYGLYPASAASGIAADHVIYGHMPEEQAVTFAGTSGSPATVLPNKVEIGETQYITTPDMSCCLMTAENKGVTLSENQAVTLAFKPFASVLDITIKGPAELNTVPDYRVTSVKVIADAPIVGDFSYDFTKSTLEEAFKSGKDTSDSLTISTVGYDEKGNLLGMPLAHLNTLRVQAFILPNPNVKNITVQVFTSDFRVWTKKLTMTTTGDVSIFKPSQIHKVTLPELVADEAKFNYDNWIGQLDPRIYLSELSLPGSTSSFSWKEGAPNPMQHLTAKQQLAAGIRVFRCHIWLYDMPSIIPGAGGPAFGINVNGSTYVRPFAEVVRELATELQENHPDEFCVLMVADYKQTIQSASGTEGSSDYIPASPQNASWNTDNGKTFYERFKVIMNRMVELGYVPGHIDANTTIGDVRGKVIVKLQMNADGGYNGGLTENLNYFGGANSNDQMNSLLAKISGWSACEGAPALMNWWTRRNGTTLFYAPMTFGQVGSFDYTEFKANTIGAPTRGTVTVKTQGLAPEAAQMLVNNATRVPLTSGMTGAYRGSCNVIDPPTDFDNNNKMWYVYGAQANPSNAKEWEFAQSLVSGATDAIRTYYNYNSLAHNKIFMVYLGGNGKITYDDNDTGDHASDITNTLVPLWNNNVNAANYGTQRPYGWVLFNQVPGADEAITGDASNPTPEYLVRAGIQKVITRNSESTDFLLRRRISATPSAAPAGDTQGTKPGGSPF